MPDNQAQLRLAEERKPYIYEQMQGDMVTAAILRLSWDLGLSASEISTLQWSDLDLSRGRLRIQGREVPLPEEGCAFFTHMDRNGPYVISTRRSRGVPVSRVTISRKARAALDAAGLPEVDLSALREACILRWLGDHPLETVARMSGFEIRTLRDLYHRHTGRELPVLRRETSFAFDQEALREALKQEGDTPGTRVVLLSWLGGLRLREMQALRWKDLSLTAKKWKVSGKKRPIPAELLPHLRRWRDTTRTVQEYVLQSQGVQPMELAFLTRRAAEFFIRYGLQEMTLFSIRGRRESDHTYKNKILEQAGDQGLADAGAISKALGLSPRVVRHLLDEMVSQGLLAPVEEAPAEKPPTARDQLRVILEEKKGQTVTTAQLKAATGLENGLLQYHIKYFVENGVLKKVKQGLYQC